MLQRLTLKKRMWLLLGAFFMSIVTMLLIILPGLQSVRIGGPLYTEISNSKDLVADILPPPLYVIEAHLAAQEFISSSSQAERSEHLERLRKLRGELADRKSYWENIDFGAEIKSQLFGGVIPTAEKFIDEMLKELPGLGTELSISQEESVDKKMTYCSENISTR